MDCQECGKSLDEDYKEYGTIPIFYCGDCEIEYTMIKSSELEESKDKKRLDFLQNNLGSYTGKVICRMSTSGRGWRLHETSLEDAVDSVRKAIDKFIEEIE